MRNKIRRQNGLTLIELAIAMALGLLISGSILSLFISAKHSYRLQTAAGDLHNNARFALDFIGQHIRLAGFRGLQHVLTAEPADAFAIDNKTGFSLAGQIVTGRDDDDSTRHINEESISLRYRGLGADTLSGASPLLDCYGNTVAADKTVILTFRLNRDKALVCAVAGGVPAYQPLVQNVADLEIWYGVDTDDDDSINSYLSASAIATTPGVSWRRVRAVKIALLFSSDNANLTSTKQQYLFAQDSPNPFATTAVVAQDRRLHRIFTTTFYLRNPNT